MKYLDHQQVKKGLHKNLYRLKGQQLEKVIFIQRKVVASQKCINDVIQVEDPQEGKFKNSLKDNRRKKSREKQKR